MQPANCLSASAGWLGSASPATSSCGRPPDPAHDGEGRCPGSRPRLNGGVALGRGGELAGAIEGAEVVGELVVHERPRSMLGVNRHPAHWVEREALSLKGAPTGGLEEVDRLGDVAELAPPARMEEDVAMWGHGAEFATAGYPRRRGTRARDDHLATGGEGGDPGGDVDRRAEPVAVALDRGPGVEADPDAGKTEPRAHLAHDPHAEGDRVASLVAADHQRVPERLHLLRPVLGKQNAGVVEEAGGEICRLGVAVDLGERGEAGEVGEEERVLGGLGRVHRFSFSRAGRPHHELVNPRGDLGQPRPDPARAPRPSVSPCLYELPLIAVSLYPYRVCCKARRSQEKESDE